jgi:hypothetical protein
VSGYCEECGNIICICDDEPQAGGLGMSIEECIDMMKRAAYEQGHTAGKREGDEEREALTRRVAVLEKALDGCLKHAEKARWGEDGPSSIAFEFDWGRRGWAVAQALAASQALRKDG